MSSRLLNDEHRVRIRNRSLTFLDEEDETVLLSVNPHTISFIICHSTRSRNVTRSSSLRLHVKTFLVTGTNTSIVPFTTDLYYRGNLVNDLIGIIDVHLQKRYVLMDQDPMVVLTLRRSVKLLNGIIKEFASIKMLNGVKTMANVRLFFVSTF